jgi:hypothetical protein
MPSRSLKLSVTPIASIELLFRNLDDINHSIPKDLHQSLKDYPIKDMVGMFHCGKPE